MTLESRIRGAIQLLPGDPEEIATFLYLQDIRGRKSRGNDCPIARYIRKEFTAEERAAYDICVSPTGCDLVDSDGDNLFLASRHYMFPESISKFITKFDTGHYEMLEDNDYPTFIHSN